MAIQNKTKRGYAKICSTNFRPYSNPLCTQLNFFPLKSITYSCFKVQTTVRIPALKLCVSDLGLSASGNCITTDTRPSSHSGFPTLTLAMRPSGVGATCPLRLRLAAARSEYNLHEQPRATASSRPQISEPTTAAVTTCRLAASFEKKQINRQKKCFVTIQFCRIQVCVYRNRIDCIMRQMEIAILYLL